MVPVQSLRELGGGAMTGAHLGRRRFLRDAAVAAGSLAALSYTRLTRAQPKPLQIVPVADGMIAVVGPNATVLAADSSEGIVLVDGGDAAWSEPLLQTVAARTGSKPYRALFNTHWHSEQTGSNETLGARGVEIIAHENTKLWLGTEVWVRWSDQKFPPLPMPARPTTTFYDSNDVTTFRFGALRVECGHLLKAHTDGDMWAFFPDENVLAVGGAVSNDGWPIIDWWTGGWLVGMVDAFDTLLQIANDRTRIVPGTGPVMSLADLKAQQQMYSTIFDRLQELFTQARDTQEVLAAKPTAEYDAKWGNPELFLTLAFQSFWGHLRDNHDRRLRSGA
jgi:glyoxylase-like metal-dependent hydrolase (beta-lactamase superfamily II)